MSIINFDASQVAPSQALDPIPAGWYNAAIDQSELKPTKDGSGMYLEVRFTVLDGQYAGRKVFHNFNIRNNNAQAVEIAYKDLSAICHAVGILQCQDSEQLHGRPLRAKVTLKPSDGTYEARNEIRGYKNINDADAPVGNGHQAMNGFPGVAPMTPAIPQQQQTWAPPPPPQPTMQQQPAMQQHPAQASWGQPPMQPPAQQQQMPPPLQAAPQPPFAQQPMQPPAQPPQAQPAWANAPVQPWTQQPQQAEAPPPVATPVSQTQSAPPPWVQQTPPAAA